MASALSRKTPGSGRSLNADRIMPFKTPSEREPLLNNAPEDRFQLAYVIFFLHGIGHLLPWNFFITAQPYFKMKFTCPHGNHSEHCGGFIKSSFENWFSLASMLPIFVMSAVNIWLQSKFHYRIRMVVSLLVMLLLFLLTTALVAVPVTHWTDEFFALTLLSVFIMNTASSIFQSSTFGFAGVLPNKYTSSVMSGQAVAGVFAAVASILFSVISGSVSGGESHKSITNSAYAYFSVACLVIILCLISVYFLNRMPFVQFYFEKSSVQIMQQKQQKAVDAAVQTTEVRIRPSYFTILKQVWWYAVSVYVVFTVTLSVFPALLSQIVSAAPNPSGWTGDTYFPLLVCFLMFNVSDLIGRYITHWIQVGNHHVSLLAMCALRCVFIPAFLFCKQQVKDPLIPTYPNVSEYDIIPIVLVLLFGLSNGYLGSTAMVTAPQRVRGDDRETASTIMAFFLSGGLLSGGALSFLWTYLAGLSHS